MLSFPRRYDLVINQGSTLSEDIPIAPWDLALDGYTIEAVVRSSPDASSEILDFSTVTTPIAVDVSGDLNHIAIRLTDEETAALTPGRYVWDVYGTLSGARTRLYEGHVDVSPGVTS